MAHNLNISQSPHGGNIYAVARQLGLRPEELLDFSSNSNVFAESLTAGLIKNTPYPFRHYPDSYCQGLSEALAGLEGLSPEHILPGNGGADMIWLLLRALAPRSVVCLGPAFSEYTRACEALDIPCQVLRTLPENDFACEADELRALRESPAELVILCSPNNPAGLAYPNLPAILRAARAPRILLDLSYRDFLHGYAEHAWHTWAECSSMIRPGVNLFTLHSFTKFFACPGLRLGYLIGDPQSIKRLMRQRPAWSVSPFAQELGLKFLEELPAYQATLPALRHEQHSLGIQLRQLGIFEPERVFEGPSFFCCGLTEATLNTIYPEGPAASRYSGYSAALQNALLRRRLLVRNCDNIPGMPLGYVRLQVRGADDNALLLSALHSCKL